MNLRPLILLTVSIFLLFTNSGHCGEGHTDPQTQPQDIYKQAPAEPPRTQRAVLEALAAKAEGEEKCSPVDVPNKSVAETALQEVQEVDDLLKKGKNFPPIILIGEQHNDPLREQLRLTATCGAREKFIVGMEGFYFDKNCSDLLPRPYEPKEEMKKVLQDKLKIKLTNRSMDHFYGVEEPYTHGASMLALEWQSTADHLAFKKRPKEEKKQDPFAKLFGPAETETDPLMKEAMSGRTPLFLRKAIIEEMARNPFFLRAWEISKKDLKAELHGVADDIDGLLKSDGDRLDGDLKKIREKEKNEGLFDEEKWHSILDGIFLAYGKLQDDDKVKPFFLIPPGKMLSDSIDAIRRHHSAMYNWRQSKDETKKPDDDVKAYASALAALLLQYRNQAMAIGAIRAYKKSMETGKPLVIFVGADHLDGLEETLKSVQIGKKASVSKFVEDGATDWLKKACTEDNK